MDTQLLILFGAVFALLSAGSLTTWILMRRREGEPGAVLLNLRSRCNAWWVMAAVFAMTLVIGKTGTFGFYALLSFLALREFITLNPTPRGDHRTLAWVFFVILPLQYLFAWAPWYGMFQIWIPVYAFVLIPVRSALAGETEGFLSRCAKIQWGVLTCVYFLSHLPMLLYLPIPGYEGQNAKLLFFLVMVTQMSDVLQYVFGKLYGKRKLAPKVSPSKTWEGLIGGGLAATGLGAALSFATPFTPWQAAAMAGLLVLTGFLGGLVMSAVKRSLQAKDWGHGIPGHGGVLDRLDSILFSAPVFFHVVGFYFGDSMARVYPMPDWLSRVLMPFSQ
ncbi:MAG: phosphatidate cytidylyltransferase [Verrucomicrobiales bacterium]|nr:phosphatidate cytidylyltransferase [Verrucomicrobiales bacterium]